MDIGDAVGRVRQLSDDELLAGLSGALGSSRRWTALVLAHLAEMEERRLHLLAGCDSLFSYCTLRLGMSEDEACRRIEVARLARRFPELYEMLASGSMSLSAVALLKHHLSESNHAALLAAVSNKTVRQAREVLAAWFPQADVPQTVRKLPERGPPMHSSEMILPSTSSEVAAQHGLKEPHAAGAREAATPPPSPVLAPLPARAHREVSAIQPVSPARYRITFTADAELKRKLELATDLLRHAVPSGDLATLVGRAIDLLVEQTLRRRFGKTSRAKQATASTSPSREPAAKPTTAAVERPVADGAPAGSCPASSAAATPSPARPATTDSSSASSAPTGPAPSSTVSEPTPHPCRHIPSAVRRTVLDRDGLRCAWRSPDGTQCESHAWIERDHITPRGQGGCDHASNIRHLCRAHNRLAAEQVYGKSTITRIIARRRTGRAEATTS